MSPRSINGGTRPSIWKVPLALVVIGVSLTAVFASQQAHSEAVRVDHDFTNKVAALESVVSAAISERIAEFNVGLDFISSSTEIDNAQFDEFFARRRHNKSSPIEGDPGFSVSEIVTDTEALEIRERDAGRPDFAISAGLPSSSPEHTIITHLEHDMPVMGRSFVGFDVSSFQGLLGPKDADAATTDQVFAQVTSVSDLFGGFRLLGSSTPDEGEYEDALLYLIARYTTADGSITGYTALLESIGSIIAEVEQDVPDGFQLVASLTGAERPIAEIDRRTDTTTYRAETLNVVGTSRNEVIDLAPLEIIATASNDIKNSGRGFANIRIWAIGSIATILGSFFAAMRARQGQRLADAGTELKIAQTMASTDPLTGLLNRQGMVDAIEQPHQQAGTLLFIDIDKFKTVNDTDGHSEGDRVLRRIGQELRRVVRSRDLVCRVGGDEFLIFFPAPIADHRIADLQSLITTAVQGIDKRISCSIGAASREEGSTATIDSLLQKADAAMYSDKRSKQGVHADDADSSDADSRLNC